MRAVLPVPNQIMAQDQVQDGCIVLDVCISTGAPVGQGKALIGIFFPKMLIILASFLVELIPI